ncbi:hypothetical protein GS495_15150 [Rhodococcus hoagii]|nr:hypothetical protein [Prescottella equi]
MNESATLLRTVLCIGILTALTAGCSSNQGNDAASLGGATAVTTTSSTPTSTGAPRNAQGRIEKQFGESAGLTDQGTSQPAITFVLDNPECDQIAQASGSSLRTGCT